MIYPVIFFYIFGILHGWDHGYHDGALSKVSERKFTPKRHAQFFDLHITVGLPDYTYNNARTREFNNIMTEKNIKDTLFRSWRFSYWTVVYEPEWGRCFDFMRPFNQYPYYQYNKAPEFVDVFYQFNKCYEPPRQNNPFTVAVIYGDGLSYYAISKKGGFYLFRTFFYAGEITYYAYAKWSVHMWFAITTQQTYYSWYLAFRRLKLPFGVAVPWDSIQGGIVDFVVRAAEKHMNPAFHTRNSEAPGLYTAVSDLVNAQIYMSTDVLQSKYFNKKVLYHTKFILPANAQAADNSPLMQFSRDITSYGHHELFEYMSQLGKGIQNIGVEVYTAQPGYDYLRNCWAGSSLVLNNQNFKCATLVNRKVVEENEDKHVYMYANKPKEVTNSDAIKIVNYISRQNPIDLARDRKFQIAQFVKNLAYLWAEGHYVIFWNEVQREDLKINNYLMNFGTTSYKYLTHLMYFGSWAQALETKALTDSQMEAVKQANKAINFNGVKKYQFLYLIPELFSNPYFAAEVLTMFNQNSFLNAELRRNAPNAIIEYSIATYGFEKDICKMSGYKCNTTRIRAREPDYDFSGQVDPLYEFTMDAAWSAAHVCTQTAVVFDHYQKDVIKQVVIFAEEWPTYSRREVIDPGFPVKQNVSVAMYMPLDKVMAMKNSKNKLKKRDLPQWHEQVNVILNHNHPALNVLWTVYQIMEKQRKRV